MAKYKSGDAFIELLNAHGVDKVFLNPGFEYIDVLSCVAAARVAGRTAPQLILCLDEAVTASAAYGSYMVTGKPQVLMVHSELGTLQLGGNLQNLQWGRVPVLILAAYQESDEARTVWNGQPYDQGGIVRNSVKYERRLTANDDLHEAFCDAFRIACTEPTGPVYLSFPMGYLYGEVDKPDTPPQPAVTDALPEADINTLEQMADILLSAENPLIVSGCAGRHHENVGALITLAETLCAPVLTGYSWLNFPTLHPLCLGIEQIGGSSRQDTCLSEADVILAIDYAMPYVASALPPRPDTKILHIDIEPTTQGRPLWGRGADIFMKADARLAIPALSRLLSSKLTPEKRPELDNRFKRIAAGGVEARQKRLDDAREQAALEHVTADYVFYCLNQLLAEDVIVVNHTLSHCASVTGQLERSLPGTWFGCPSGAIGWATGAALGAASAARDRIVVAVMTDGGFVWGCPTSTLWTAGNYRFPFLTIICNNGGYGAIRDVQAEMQGGSAPGEAFTAESAVNFTPDYAMLAQGAGAFGRTVTKQADVMSALGEALGAVRAGRPAVLDVRLPYER